MRQCIKTFHQTAGIETPQLDRCNEVIAMVLTLLKYLTLDFI